MTAFEQFALETIGKVETGTDGFYTGHTLSLMTITNDIILSDDEKKRNLSWEEQKELIRKRFFETFPYMRK